jgi:hypothetical protein
MSSTKKLLFSVLFILIMISSLVMKFTDSNTEAKALSDHCQGENRESCLSMEILAFANEHPEKLDALFAEFSQLLQDGILEDDPRIFSPIVHELGMELAFKNVPPEVAFDYCPLNFKAGCLHGVVMEYVDAIDTLDPQTLFSFCDFTKVDNTYYLNCLHGIGHELAAKNPGDLQSILDQCTLPTLPEVHACTTGVFMEFSTGIHGTGQHTHDASVGSILLPCSELSSTDQPTCYVALSNYRQYLPTTESFINTSIICKNTTEQYQDECLLGLAEKIYTSTAENLAESELICESFDSSLIAGCKTALNQMDTLDSIL